MSDYYIFLTYRHRRTFHVSCKYFLHSNMPLFVCIAFQIWVGDHLKLLPQFGTFDFVQHHMRDLQYCKSRCSLHYYRQHICFHHLQSLRSFQLKLRHVLGLQTLILEQLQKCIHIRVSIPSLLRFRTYFNDNLVPPKNGIPQKHTIYILFQRLYPLT